MKHPCNHWSGTDTATMRERVEAMRPKGAVQWALSLVLTPEGFKARYDQAGDAKEDNFYVDLPVQIGKAAYEPAWERQIERLEVRHQQIMPAGRIDPIIKPPAQSAPQPGARSDLEQLELFELGLPGGEPWPNTYVPGQDDIDLQALDLTAGLVEQRARSAHSSPRFQCKRFFLLTHPALCSTCAFGSDCFQVTPDDLRSHILQGAAFA